MLFKMIRPGYYLGVVTGVLTQHDGAPVGSVHENIVTSDLGVEVVRPQSFTHAYPIILTLLSLQPDHLTGCKLNGFKREKTVTLSST